MTSLAIGYIRSSNIKLLKNNIMEADEVTSVLSSLEEPALLENGIDLKVITQRGEVTFQVRVTNYSSVYMFYRTKGLGFDEDDIFKSKADYTIHIFGDDKRFMYRTSELILALREKMLTSESRVGNGKKTGRCNGKLVSVSAVAELNMLNKTVVIKNLVLNPSSSNTKRIEMMRKHCKHMSDKRVTSQIVKGAMTNVFKLNDYRGK